MKDKEFEEMAKMIDDRLIEARGYLGSMNKGEGYWIAQKLVEHYQPKIPEDSVIIPKSEYNKLTLLAKECIEWRGKNCNTASLPKEDSVVLSTEHIKKIKQIIDNICEAELGQVHASSKDGKVTKTVDTSLIAKNIYEHLTENIVINTPTIQCENYSNGDMVVISKEEYEKLKQFAERLKQMPFNIEFTFKESSYEDIKKLANLMKNYSVKYIDETLKEFIK